MNTRLLVSRNKREGGYMGTCFVYSIDGRKVHKRMHERSGPGPYAHPSLRDWKRQ